MKKVFQYIAGLLFAAFTVGMLGLLITITYAALQRIFPNNPDLQLWGLVLFDIAAIAWFLAFVFKSETVTQYGAAGAGFIAAFIGTLAMVAAEVLLGNGSATNAPEISRWMNYSFIGVTALHVGLLYLHHFGGPTVYGKVSTGIARGEIVSQAMNEATKALEAEKHILARTITAGIISDVKRDLGLYPVEGTPFEPRQLTAPQPLIIPHPTGEDNRPISDDERRMYAPGTHFRDGTITPTDLNDPFWSEHPHHMNEKWGNKEAAQKASPFPGYKPE